LSKIKGKQTNCLVKYAFDSRRLKVKLYGDVRDEILTELHNTFFFLPRPLEEFLKQITKFRIIKSTNRSTDAGIFNIKNFNLTLYDRKWLTTEDYSQIVMHEIGHLIFHVFVIMCENNNNKEPIHEFARTVNAIKLKPISKYSHDLKQKKLKNPYDWRYASEVFAEYIGFTYSRYTEEKDVKGSFCNYIKVRNAVWNLFDDVTFGDEND
jgi:predicted SprT family Zn-dependent metalloprotease